MVSNSDTVYVNLRVDEDSSFIQSKSVSSTYQGPWTWHKALIVGLIGLCIIGIILALLFFILGKKFNKSGKKSTVTGSETTKSVVSKGISPKSEYSPVPTSV